MGIRLQVDLETNRGPTDELYIRIDHYRINRTVGKIKFSSTLWLNKELADQTLKEFADDPIKPSIGLVNPKVIYYPNKKSEGLDVTFTELYEVPLVVEKDIKKDIIETVKVKKEVPYISFDDNGDEITLYRTVEVEEDKVVGVETITKKIVDFTILNKFEKFCYNHIVEKLSEVIPKNKIEKLY